MPLLRDNDIVCISKHLCGSGADFSLRAIVKAYRQRIARSRRRQGDGDGEMPLFHGCGDVVGVFLATCCHHRCEYQHFVGRPQLHRLGFSIEEFGIIRRLSSWATSGDAVDDSSREIGRSCKRFLDVLRVLYLRENGFDTQLTPYVEACVTPENVLIEAVPRSPAERHGDGDDDDIPIR